MKSWKDRLRAHRRRRASIQALGALAFNGHLTGFLKGQIYKGPLKSACVPVFNCYSCPGALGACPIGSLQAVPNDAKFNVTFYVSGLIALFGILMGRWFCGRLCPFGWIQELLYKIPVPKLRVPRKIHRPLTLVKYALLVVFVFALPFFMQDQYGLSDPTFCKWICPAGTLEAGLPLLATNEPLRASMGALFGWKLFLLIAFIAFAMLIQRVFCRYICPLGAIYGLLNPVSFYRMSCSDACIRCGRCNKVCPMDVEPFKTPNSPECIRCGDCIPACPVSALKLGFRHDGITEFDYKAAEQADENAKAPRTAANE